MSRPTQESLDADPTRYFDPVTHTYKLKRRKQHVQSDADLGGNRATKQERDELPALEPKGKGKGRLDYSLVPLHIRITRVMCGRGRPYDDDNLSGGCKELRDAIAAILGRSGDSKEDGLYFEYAQRRGETTQTIIEIEEVTENGKRDQDGDD